MCIMATFSRVAGLLLIAMVCFDVEALDFAANNDCVRVHQRTSVNRRKRDVHRSETVEFPESMTFDMDDGKDVHTLTLTQKSDFHSHARVFDGNGEEIDIYHWAYTGIYEDLDNNAVVAVDCKDTTGCTLQGSFDVGQDRYKIDPPKQGNGSEFHRVRRAVNRQTADPFQDIVIEIDANGEAHVSQEENPAVNVKTNSTESNQPKVTRRKKRATPDCAIVEISLVVDFPVFQYFLTKANNNVMAAQTAAVLFMEIAVAEVNLRLCNFGGAGCCDGECIRVYPTAVHIPTVASQCWTNGLGVSPFNNGKLFLLLPDRMYACNAAIVAPGDIIACVTGMNLATLLSDGRHHSYRDVYFPPGSNTVCPITAPTPRGVVDFFQDNIGLSIAHLVGAALGAHPDSQTTCDPWNYIMGYDYWPSDHSYMQFPWDFSSCSCTTICDYIEDHRTCLDTVSFTDAEWDAFIVRTNGGLGGEVYDLDHQCDLTYPGAPHCTPDDPSIICSDGVGCDVPNFGCQCKTRVRSGTPCGDGKRCEKGSCVCFNVILNQRCCSEAFCTGQFITCTGSPSTCQCVTNYQEVSGSCVPIIIPANGDCTVPGFCTSNSACSTGLCICNMGYIAVGGVCLTESNLGESCIVGQCIIPFSSCGCNECACNNGYVAVGGVCVPGECASNTDCFLNNEVCLNNYCQCDDGFYRTSAGLCIASEILGAGCTSTGQCGPDFSYCDMDTKTCVCDGNHLDSNGASSGGMCNNVGNGLNQNCVGCTCTVPNSECVSNVCLCVAPYQEVDGGCWGLLFNYPCDQSNANTCTQGTCGANSICSCSAGQIIYAGECWLGTYNSPCSPTSTTSSFITCPIANTVCQASTSTCQCASGYVNVGQGVCEPSTGTACTTNADCAGQDVVCSGTECVCEDGHHEIDGACFPNIDLGLPCTASTTCDDPNASCVGTLCTCNGPFVDSNTDASMGGICLTTNGELCAPCDGDSSCATNLVCVSGTCRCAAGFLVVGGECVAGNRGDDCSSDPDTCTFLGTSCQSGTCECTPPSVWDPAQSTCTNGGNGAQCVTDISCATNFACVSGTCRCDDGFLLVGEDCVAGNHGDACLSNLDTCSFLGTSCQSGMCACTPPSVWDPATSTCTNGGNGAQCVTDISCATNFACVSGTCRCDDGFLLVGEDCVAGNHGDDCSSDPETCTFLGTSCQSGMCECTPPSVWDPATSTCTNGGLCAPCVTDVSCATNLACVSGTCRCAAGFFRVGDECVAGNRGDDCSSDPDTCTFLGTSCQSGTCECTPPSVWDPATSTCTNGGNGAQCVTDISCAANFACVSGTCRCDDGFLLVGEDCVAGNHGDDCSSDPETCTFLGTSCQSGMCECTPPSVWDPATSTCTNGGLCAPCVTDVSCATNLACVSGTCRCAAGFFRVGDECVAGNRGDDCSSDPDTCTFLGTSCQSGTCECTPPSVWDPATSTCTNGGNGAQCVTDISCAANFACVSGTCRCDDGFLLVGEDCVAGNHGDDCSSDPETCTFLGTSCQSGMCECTPPSVWDPATSTCTNGGLCAPCVTDVSCATNLACVSGTCRCAAGFFRVGDECVAGNRGDDCSSNPDTCTFPGTTCQSSVCECTPPSTWDVATSTCLTVSGTVDVGDVCQGSNCVDPNAECVPLDESCDNICQCKPGYTPEVTSASLTCNSNCVLQVTIGGACDETIVNICLNPDSVACVNDKCRCISPFTFDAVQQTCVRVPKNYGETCTCEDECQPEATVVCDTATDTCQCRSGFVFDTATSSCALEGIFGDSCATGGNAMSCASPFMCIGLSMSSAKACQCPGSNVYNPLTMDCD